MPSFARRTQEPETPSIVSCSPIAALRAKLSSFAKSNQKPRTLALPPGSDSAQVGMRYVFQGDELSVRSTY